MSNQSSPHNLKNMVFAGRDKAAEVAERRKIQEKEREAKLETKKREQEEKLMRVAEHKNRELQEKLRLKAQKELEKSKAALDRRAAQLEQDKARKQEILQKAHSAVSRTAQTSPKKIFAFGSSTPRELSYLEKLAKDQKQYDKKLTSIDASSNGSQNGSPPRVIPVKKAAPMTASLYVPSKAGLNKAVSKEKNVLPKKISPGKTTGMTQSMYDPNTKPKPSRQVTTSGPIPPKRSMVDGSNKKPPIIPQNLPKKASEARKSLTKKVEPKKTTVTRLADPKPVAIAVPRKIVQVASNVDESAVTPAAPETAQNILIIPEFAAIKPSLFEVFDEPVITNSAFEKDVAEQPSIEIVEEEVKHENLDNTLEEHDTTNDLSNIPQVDIKTAKHVNEESLSITESDLEIADKQAESDVKTEIQVDQKVEFVEEPKEKEKRDGTIILNEAEHFNIVARESLNISQLANDFGNLNLSATEPVPEDPVAAQLNDSEKSNHTDDELEALDTAHTVKQEIIKPAADNDMLTDPRTESPDSGNALSASSSPKESDSENNEIVRPTHDYARENRRAKLSEILSMARGTGSPTAQLKQQTDPAQLAKELLEQRRQMRNVNSGSDLEHSREGNEVTAVARGVSLTLAEELKEASRQAQSNDVLPGQIVYDDLEHVHQV